MHSIGTAVLLTAHLLLVNVAMLGPLAAAWYDWRARRLNQPELGKLAQNLAFCSLAALILGSLLGGVLLAGRYATDDRYFRAIAALPDNRIWFAAMELVFSLLCLILYWALWNYWQRGRIGHRIVAIASSSNLMMHFPAFFIVISIIASRPGLWSREVQRDEYRGLLAEPEVLSRVLHVWLAAAAVVGLVIVWLAIHGTKSLVAKGPAPQDGGGTLENLRRAQKSGARLALTAVMLQFPVGLWVALVMPEASRETLLGGDAAASLLFLGAVMLALLLMHLLSAFVLGEGTRGQAGRATVVLAILVLLMVGLRLRTNVLLQLPTAAQTRNSNTSTHLETDALGRLASSETSGSIGEKFPCPPVRIQRFLP